MSGNPGRHHPPDHRDRQPSDREDQHLHSRPVARLRSGRRVRLDQPGADTSHTAGNSEPLQASG